MNVPVSELKAHLSEYLSKAQDGEQITITSHNNAVCRLIGVPPTDKRGIELLLIKGIATWGGGKPAGARIELAAGGKPISDMILEDRK
jgi:prevent-host-death family protein